MPRRVAALFVQTEGVYSQIDGVDVWGVERDARLYDKNYPVVAHPPCARWGRYWGGPTQKKDQRLGNDQGCFAAALTQ